MRRCGSAELQHDRTRLVGVSPFTRRSTATPRLPASCHRLLSLDAETPSARQRANAAIRARRSLRRDPPSVGDASIHELSMIFKSRNIFPAIESGSINQQSHFPMLIDKRINLRRHMTEVVSLQFFRRNDPQNIARNIFSPNHAKPNQIFGRRAIGSAAVVTFRLIFLTAFQRPASQAGNF